MRPFASALCLTLLAAVSSISIANACPMKRAMPPVAEEAMVAKAEAAQKRGDDAGAIAAWEKLMNSGSPAFARAMGAYGAGKVHQKLGNNAAALNRFRRAAGLNPNHHDARAELGALLVDGADEEAVNHLRAALGGPLRDSQAARVALAQALLNLDQPEEASRVLAAARKVAPRGKKQPRIDEMEARIAAVAVRDSDEPQL